ncbi:hypothetical protein [Pseudobutyrivibrio xylanivorans]|uniref:Uncharacterized protein n=1 Tax=Pseudobutyrivibrio xylanivorans TaxID=185007 RepID=A0A1G5S022_PSEXY|nr:hypothetical protein [Pseudobutyrivibrio xylanivorans]SCZ79745.1 hypothetical protein SAMN02910350_01933 [Pseudobutyrivibrio xylanivorans]
MKRKKFLAMALAMSMAAGVAGTTLVSMNVSAAQIQDASQVNYGTLTAKELEMVNQYFDAKFYAAKYEDVVSVLGTDADLLYKHFVNCGIFEGREGWATYNVEDFNSVVIAEDAHFVSVEVYAASNLMGTTDYATIERAAVSANENGASIVNTDEASYVVASAEVAEALAENDPHYEKIGTLNIGRDGECCILVYKKDNGYATKFLEGDYTAIYTGICETVSSCTDIVGFIPFIGYDVAEANALSAAYGIETFDVDTGVVVGSEGAYFTLDDQIEYVRPVEFEAPHARNMTNYTNNGYENNAYTGVDENATADTTFDISAGTEADENGNVNVTAVISNDETGFNYTITYQFDGNVYSSVADTAADTAATETPAETTVEE